MPLPAFRPGAAHDGGTDCRFRAGRLDTSVPLERRGFERIRRRAPVRT
jgi:hypothetical protein